MKAEELMVGDWVYNRITGKNFQVYPYMFPQMFRETPNADTEDFGVLAIPITEELLAKNGWNDWKNDSTIARSCSSRIDTKTSISFQQIKGYTEIFTQIHHCGVGTFEFRKHLRYVHELQNAFRLLGIEKEIVV